MHTYETLGHMIIQELINIRRDFKFEVQRLGDRLEKCLNFQTASSSNVCSSTNIDARSTVYDHPMTVPQSKNFLPHLFAGSDGTSLLKSYRSIDILPKNAHNIVDAEAENTTEELSKLQETVVTAPSGVASVPIPKIEEDHQDKSFPMPSTLQVEQSLLNIAASENAPPSLLPSYPVTSLSSSTPLSLNETSMKSRGQKGKKSTKPKVKYQRPSVKRFQCDICYKFFYTDAYLKCHRKTHMGIKPYACALCSLSFTRRMDLDRHMRLHTGETPFACEKCGRKFARNDALKSHMRVHEKKKFAEREKPGLCVNEVFKIQEGN